MESAVKGVVLPANNAAVQAAILNEGLEDTENQIQLAQGDSLLSRIVRTLVEARLDAHFLTGMCPRNYTIPCPRGYSIVPSTEGENTLCVPDQPDDSLPVSCATFRPNLHVLEKSDFALKCKTEWPCAACTKSYLGCPEKFRQDANVCKSTAEYIGPCNGSYDFGKFAPIDKARWAASCYTHWPCDPE
jgi:CPW-WPC domain-containing protein